jgi:nanoRNase/pAp phosphatase (c-di-AMP/oligoRNAs hydrolase)
MTHEEKSKVILKKLKASKTILIIPSSPIDKDCVASALSLHWLLNQISDADIKIYSFHKVPNHFDNFAGIENITYKNIKKVDLNIYDSIILVDGNAWHQFLGPNFQNESEKIDKEKIIHIDHHPSGVINKEINDEYDLVIDDVCTAKIIYDYFIKPENLTIDGQVAMWLYSALLYDTDFFRYGVKKDTYTFAQELMDFEVSHELASDENISEDSIKFLTWALENTNYYPELKLTTLVIDPKRDEKILGLITKHGSASLVTHLYIEHIIRKIEGYNYGILFRPKMDGGVIATWRTRELGDNLEVREVLESVGFRAGGHRNAGSGSHDELSPKEAEEKVVDRLRVEVRNKY